MTCNDKVPELTNGEFENFVKNGIVFVDFFAEWCMPCVMMGPVIDDLSEEFCKKVKFGKVNIDDNSGLAEKFGISSIPTFIIFKDGKTVEQVIGSRTHEEISEVIAKHI